jgi:MFS family permease
VGALTAALALALRKSVVGLTRSIQRAAGIFGVGLILFGLSHVLWLSLLTMLLVGYGMMTGLAASNTVIQTLVPEEMRGRVMSFYTMAFVGMAPFGSLLAGGLAHRVGAPHTVMITGTCCLLGCGWFTLQLPKVRRVMRPIYLEMGLIRHPGEPVMEDQAGTS